MPVDAAPSHTALPAECDALTDEEQVQVAVLLALDLLQAVATQLSASPLVPTTHHTNTTYRRSVTGSDSPGQDLPSSSTTEDPPASSRTEEDPPAYSRTGEDLPASFMSGSSLGQRVEGPEGGGSGSSWWRDTTLLVLRRHVCSASSLAARSGALADVVFQEMR